ncbi:MAG: hypothetical protein KAU26_07345 [Methylococcales bacterium]|nr:hypothetical protein [Methylococcales bacterium]
MNLQKKTLIILLTLSFSAVAGDLDDGIALDTPINDDLKLDTNVLFLIKRAEEKVKEKQKNPSNKRIITNEKCGGTGNINLTGTKLKSNTTIINLANIKNSSSVCKK